mmetsp:Transcript_64120/g.105298  ORF Transcript_64120/g.105298 Transcript_64120/m.105298 type:complete len:153 (-) Transcript_64120:7-465(-)
MKDVASKAGRLHEAITPFVAVDCANEKHDPAATAPMCAWQHAAKEPPTTPPAVKPTSAKIRKKAGIRRSPIPAPTSMDKSQSKPQCQNCGPRIIQCGRAGANWVNAESRRCRGCGKAPARSRLIKTTAKIHFHGKNIFLSAKGVVRILPLES